MAGGRQGQGAGNWEGPLLAITAMFFRVYLSADVSCLYGNCCSQISVLFTHLH